MIRLEFVDRDQVLDALPAAAEVVARSGVVLFPTESFYGLGGDPWDRRAAAKIHSMKDRPAVLAAVAKQAGSARKAGSGPTPALGRSEQRLVSVVVAGPFLVARHRCRYRLLHHRGVPFLVRELIFLEERIVLAVLLVVSGLLPPLHVLGRKHHRHLHRARER